MPLACLWRPRRRLSVYSLFAFRLSFASAGGGPGLKVARVACGVVFMRVLSFCLSWLRLLWSAAAWGRKVARVACAAVFMRRRGLGSVLSFWFALLPAGFALQLRCLFSSGAGFQFSGPSSCVFSCFGLRVPGLTFIAFRPAAAAPEKYFFPQYPAFSMPLACLWRPRRRLSVYSLFAFRVPFASAGGGGGS